MKLTTATIEGQQRDDPQNKNVFSPSSVLTDFPLVLDLAGVSVTAGIMVGYLDPTEAAQVVQLLQGGTSIRTNARKVCCVSHHSLQSIAEIPGGKQSLKESWTVLRKILNHQQLLRCERGTG